MLSLAEQVENAPEEMYQITYWFTAVKSQIEESQDNIADHLHLREGEAPSVVGSQRTYIGSEIKLPHCPSDQPLVIVGKASLPSQPCVDLNGSITQGKQQDENSEHGSQSSVKATKARIKAEVATLRVKQEKERYIEACQLKMKKERDEAETAALEAELWNEVDETQAPSKPGLTPKGVKQESDGATANPTYHVSDLNQTRL